MSGSPNTDTQKKPRPLTTKQKKFIKAKTQGKTGVEAAMIAYDTDDYNTANVIAVENLQKPTIQQALEKEYDRQGITLERIVKPIGEALDAIKEDSDSPDHSIRLKASSMAANLIGLGKQQGEGTTNYNFVNIHDSDRGQYDL